MTSEQLRVNGISIGPREGEIWDLHQQGMADCDIADQLSISEQRVKNALGSVYRKIQQ